MSDPVDKKAFDTLSYGFKMAGAQVLMWIDEIVSCAIDGTGWYWFWHEFEGAVPCTKRMIKSLRKSIEKDGLRAFLIRHPRSKSRPRWQEYINLTCV